MPKIRVFADTNVILESFRTSCWTAISDHFAIETADKAVLVASNGLGWLDCMTSLEDLARKAGVGRVNLDALALQYREDWLSSIKTKIRMGIIP